MRRSDPNRAPLGWGHPATWIASWGGAGFLPLAPGTWGSLTALPIAATIVFYGSSMGLLVAIALVALAGWWSSNLWSRAADKGDPQAIVIDEVVGQWIVLLVTPLDFLHYAAAFALFRLFDIAKPWPVSWADQRVPGGLGVMLDDVVAGAYGFLIMLLWLWLTRG